jgi:micrococcal nuclease
VASIRALTKLLGTIAHFVAVVLVRLARLTVKATAAFARWWWATFKRFGARGRLLFATGSSVFACLVLSYSAALVSPILVPTAQEPAAAEESLAVRSPAMRAATLEPSDTPQPAVTHEPTTAPTARPTDTPTPPTATRTVTRRPTARATDTRSPPTATRTATREPTLGATPAPIAATVPDEQRATVVNIIDGDTIDVSIDAQVYRVRYIGMDTPEHDQPFFSEATQANRRLVAGRDVILVKDVSETDRFGRLLRYVYLQDGTFVNAELVRQGFALVATYPPDVRFAEHFVALQREARDDGRGLWAAPVAEATEPLPVPTAAEAAVAVCDCSGNLYNCSDFSTHSAAQACLAYCWDQVGYDIHRLDGDNDGLACESLP